MTKLIVKHFDESIRESIIFSSGSGLEFIPS